MALKIEGNRIIFDLDGRTASPDTLKVCLEYMEKVAARSGLSLPAKLIGAASQACDDVITEEEQRRKRTSTLRLA